MISIDKIVGHKNQLLFKVPLPDGQLVFMKTDLSLFYGVVIVDADRFLQLWRNEPHSIHSKQSNGDLASWRLDIKYHYAEEGFSKGLDNPVPLAEVACWKRDNYNYISYVNGVTRTIWLLSNGCKSFPVMCGINEVSDLYRLVGVPNTELITFNY